MFWKRGVQEIWGVIGRLRASWRGTRRVRWKRSCSCTAGCLGRSLGWVLKKYSGNGHLPAAFLKASRGRAGCHGRISHCKDSFYGKRVKRMIIKLDSIIGYYIYYDLKQKIYPLIFQ